MPDPLGRISELSGVALNTVIDRLRAMLAAGVIRRIRQTLLATNLAQGALVAWHIEPEKLNAAFDYMFKQDPFSGHVVIRSTDGQTIGACYRLWTTLKVPQGFSMQSHCDFLMLVKIDGHIIKIILGMVIILFSAILVPFQA